MASMGSLNLSRDDSTTTSSFLEENDNGRHSRTPSSIIASSNTSSVPAVEVSLGHPNTIQSERQSTVRLNGASGLRSSLTESASTACSLANFPLSSWTSGGSDLNSSVLSWTIGSRDSIRFSASSSESTRQRERPFRSLSSGLSFDESSFRLNTTRPSESKNCILNAARLKNWKKVITLCGTNPEAASFRCHNGLTALHHVCNNRCSDSEVYRHLIKAYPRALSHRDYKGWTPLHHAARHKAPLEGIRLLLHMFPEEGRTTAGMKCNIGRAPVYYAIRYEAPAGVVKLLLENMTMEDILSMDNDNKSPLTLVWDDFATSFDGKNALIPYQRVFDNSTESLPKIMPRSLEKRWKDANLLLKAAFRFSMKDEGIDQKLDEHKEFICTSGKKNRTWRILHATSAIRCHHTLFMMACVLHPEQAEEIDHGDLFGSNRERHYGRKHTHLPYTCCSTEQDKFELTALHLAASAPTKGRQSQAVITKLLQLNPKAASFQNPCNGSLPLHILCDNEYKSHWISDGFKDVFDEYPEAATVVDSLKCTPLHRAAAAISSRNSSRLAPTSSPVANAHNINNTVDADGSIVINLINSFSQSASLADSTGRLPFHYVAELSEGWDNEAQQLLDAFPKVLHIRAGSNETSSALPIHLTATNPDDNGTLMQNIVQNNPRAASQTNADGYLPIHLSCEAGKPWERGMEFLYNAYKSALSATREGVSQDTDGKKSWMPLHYAVSSSNTSLTTIQALVEHNRDAVSVRDRRGRTVMHLAIESGKCWDDGIWDLFAAYPAAIDMSDNDGKVPFSSAALKYCDNSSEDSNDGKTSDSLEGSSSFSIRSDNDTRRDSNENIVSAPVPLGGDEIRTINLLYNLLREAPHVIKV